MTLETDCEFLVRVRHKTLLAGVAGPITETCGLTGRSCPLVDSGFKHCTRRTWAIEYLAKQEARGEIAPKGPE